MGDHTYTRVRGQAGLGQDLRTSGAQCKPNIASSVEEGIVLGASSTDKFAIMALVSFAAESATVGVTRQVRFAKKLSIIDGFPLMQIPCQA